MQAQLEYIARENPGVAVRVALYFKKATQFPDALSSMGWEGAVQGTMELVMPRLPFICVYRRCSGQVEIPQLLHERMQWLR